MLQWVDLLATIPQFFFLSARKGDFGAVLKRVKYHQRLWIMDKNILEFWGRMFLDAIQNQQQMGKYWGQDSGDATRSNLFFKALEWPIPGKAAHEDIADLTKKSVDAYKEFVKVYLTLFNAVSQKEYRDLIAENEDLKKKIAEQEKIINTYKELAGNDAFDQGQVVDNLTRIMKNQTQQFQELMKQVNQYYKKETPSAKKK